MNSCPARLAGADIQVETVLSPLLMLQVDAQSDDPLATSWLRDLRILDYGCGGGRVLEALSTFSAEVLRQITYVGVDVDESAVASARALASRSARRGPLKNRMRSSTIAPLKWIEPALKPWSFDFIHVVNVLHHLRPSDELPTFLERAVALLDHGGYLVLEDFFLGDHPDRLDRSAVYICKNAAYVGPAELSAMFAPYATTGCFRYFRRERVTGSQWFGYTYIIRRLGRLRFGAHAKVFQATASLAFDLARAKAAEAATRSSWYTSCAEVFRTAVDEIRSKLDDQQIASELGRYYASREYVCQMYRYYDPYPPTA